MDSAQALPQADASSLVDVEQLEITHPNGLRIAFELDSHAQETLVHGLDDIARTLKRVGEISAYEQLHASRYDVRALAV